MSSNCTPNPSATADVTATPNAAATSPAAATQTPAGRYDYHVHPDYSIDAQGSIDDFCRAALERSLDEICFTTHVDTEPEVYADDSWVCVDGEWVRTDGPWIERYLGDLAEAAAKYAPLGLKVKAGLEIGFHDGVVEQLGSLVRSYPFDFILGSVHLVGAFSVSYRDHVVQLFQGHGPEAALTDYFGRVERAARCGLFDCLSHLDLYRRTLGVAAEDDIAHGKVREAACRALETAAAAGVGIEINSRSASPGPEYLSPGPALMSIAHSAGIKVITTGSDSHGPATVGRAIDVGRAQARRTGFTHLATFDQRVPRLHPILA